MVSTDGRWTIRGISNDLQVLVSTRAMVEKKTVGELVTEALAAYLGRPTQLDATESLLERVNALEARLNEMQSAASSLLSAPRPTIVSATREEAVRSYRGRGGFSPETVALVKKLKSEGRTQRQIAAEAGIAAGSVSNILNGKFD